MRLTGRGERGEVSSEVLFILLALVALLGLIAAAIAGLVRHGATGPIGATLLHGLVIVAGLAGGVFALTIAVAAERSWADRVTARAIARTREQMGDRLAGWLGLSSPGDLADWEVAAWRRAARDGLTADVAHAWSSAGLPHPLAAIAVHHGISRERVAALAQAVREAGLWDGSDRRVLHEILGEHMDCMGPYEVLSLWAQFEPDQIRQATREVLGSPEDLSARVAAGDVRLLLDSPRVLQRLTGPAAGVAA